MLAIGEIKKNSRELIKILTGVYKGREVCDARIYYEAEPGKYLPTPRGLSFSIDLLPDILKALQTAEEQRKKAKIKK
jgi:hypothetical protein